VMALDRMLVRRSVGFKCAERPRMQAGLGTAGFFMSMLAGMP
jgi:hypothetical protein